MNNTLKLVTIMVALSVTSAFAADWPWLYGPRRDHTSEQKGLLRPWPQEGPKVLWTVPMGAGFGGPAVSGGNVYLLDRDEKVGDTLRVLDLASGKELWTFAYNAAGSFMFAGSRTMPTVDGEHVYTVGPMGDLHAINTKTRKPTWRKNIWQCIIPVPQAVDAGEGRVLITGAYGAGSVMLKVDKKGDAYAVSELFKNPDFGAHTQPPVLHGGHFYSHYTINERSDGLVAMSMDGQVKWKTDQQPPFVRGGSILADGLLLMTDGNTKLYLVEPSPAGSKPLASAVILEPGDNWAPLALADGKLLVRGQKELKALQVAR